MQQIQNATCSTIAIIEWVNALELMVKHSHLDKRIDAPSIGIMKALKEVIHELLYHLDVLRRHIDDLLCDSISQHRPRKPTKASVDGTQQLTPRSRDATHWHNDALPWLPA